MLPEQQQRILGYFIEEARDHLNTIEQGLLNLESTLNDPEMISEVFRAAHSIKGGAAMLGLTSIQHTSHRLEDCFKVLKEHPVKIDQKLESLFLGVSDTLKALLEQLSGPFGLSEDAANTLMSETEPVFQWLNEHLEFLVQQGNSDVENSTATKELHPASVDSVTTLTELFLRQDISSLPKDDQQSTETSSSAPPEVRPLVTAKATENWGEFQTQVLQTLREMLKLFKQTTTPETRQNLQQCCEHLARIGAVQNLTNWCGLCQVAASAIINPENSYLTLAKIIITEIKQAQELVLQGREPEITISQQLEALVSFAEIELLEIPTDLFDEQPVLEAIVLNNNLEAGNIEDFVAENSIINLPESTEASYIEDTSDNFLSAIAENTTTQATPTLNSLFDHEGDLQIHPITRSNDQHGPEVGIAELNTLADLFEGDTPDLDETWHQEEILDINSINESEIDFSISNTEDADSDLSDLLSFDEDTSYEQNLTSTTTVEDLSLLFGDNFLEKENLELKNSQTSAEIIELSNIANPINLDSVSANLEISENEHESKETSEYIVQESVSENDIEADLLALELPVSEVSQAKAETNVNIEPLTNQQNDLDELFLTTGNPDWVEKITQDDYVESPTIASQADSLSLESLFTQTEDVLPPADELEVADLFDINPTIAFEFPHVENDISIFWNQETTVEQQHEFDSLIEQDVVKALEESLFAAAADDEMFSESQQSILSSPADFDLEDFDSTFLQSEQEQDLILSLDTGNDLFEEFASTNPAAPTISDNLSSEAPISPQEIHSLSQEPESLDFIPEFTNQSTELSPDQNINLFDSLDDSSDETQQFFFEDLASINSTYIQVDVAEELATADINLSFTETSDSALDETQPRLLFNAEDENILENSQLLFDDTVSTNSSENQLDTTRTLSTADINISFTETSDLALDEIQPSLLFNAEDENILENSQLLFDDVTITDSTYIELDISENFELVLDEIQPSLLFNTEDESLLENSQLLFDDVVSTNSPENQLDIANDLATADINISFAETSDLALDETQPSLLFNAEDESILENSQLLLDDVVSINYSENQLDIAETLAIADINISFAETSDLALDETQPSLLFNAEDESILENSQLLFDDVVSTNFSENQLDIADNLATADINISFAETSDSALDETQPSLLLNAEDESILENSQLLFDDVVSTNSLENQLDIADNLPTEAARDINFIETSNFPAQTTNSENLDTELGFINDLFFTETTQLKIANQEELETIANIPDSDFQVAETLIHQQEVSHLALDENLAEEESVSFDQTEEFVVTSTSGTPEIPEAVILENDTPTHDEFADLEALLEEEPTPTSKVSSIQEVDFDALEALLGADNNEKTVTYSGEPFTTQPVLAQPLKPTLKAVPSPNIDEFGDLEKLLAEADQTISHASVVKTNTTKSSRSSTRRAARFEETMKVPVKQLDDMSNLVGELVVNRNTLEQDHERLRQSLDNLLIQVQQLSDVGARMQELYERSLLEASLLAGRKKKDTGSTPSHDADTDRGFSELEMDRFTPFHTLSQQMIERIVRVRESASDIDFVTEETERVARQFRQVTTQLQEGLTRARMVPFAQTIDRWRRGVRDTAIKCGKQVELVIEGGDTLIDKMILDHLTDPLTHMLNNAIAHGIETPEERQAAGKPPIGIITIRAFHQGNQTVVSVGDDGAGIDSARVKAKAVKLSIITEIQAKTMTRAEVYDLLFQSGFTIKDQADEISGRGVGMDVVRSEISEIRGTVNTDSTLGKGTTFTIRLPLTLSICKALCCVSDKARIAFPMDGVEDTLDIPVKNIQHNVNGQTFISWRDTLLPFRPLKELLTFNRQLSRGNVYGGNRDDDMVSVVVVRSGSTLIALQIDQVLSEQEIVIKQFEGPAPKPIGVAGATVLGDGRIMPIADVLEIIDIFQGRISTQIGGGSWQQQGTPTVPDPVKIDPTVLIVDDSITVRELLSLTFNKAGYRVEQARDGQEAWDKLRSGLPCDIVFCDIEMPRCDGLELLSRIQKDSNLNHLPIAMLTSRGADKHRQMAVQLGASGYFTKPYLEEALLEAAGRMLKGEKLVTSNGNV